jgi:hypothetical protein
VSDGCMIMNNELKNMQKEVLCLNTGIHLMRLSQLIYKLDVSQLQDRSITG